MKIICDPSLTVVEVEKLVGDVVKEWEDLGKDIAEIRLSIDGSEVIVETYEKSPIKRVRRITGYLSNIENFNKAKQAECRDRVIHSHK